ncbi:MAG: hypothetical protein Q8Q87_02520 [Candidatus Omnitrophota bacterium]|nr:hypothetical protein [Candidatus Omnitrophota bacterium]
MNKKAIPIDGPRMEVCMRRFLLVIIASIFMCGIALMAPENGFAKCEAALKRLKAAEAELNAANAAYNAAEAALANLNAAVANLNAVAKKLGATGGATVDSATFGRSPANPSFFDDQGYKAAKQAWQDARAAYDKTGGLDACGARRMRAQGEYDDAEAEYKRLRAEHIGDEGLLRAPEPLKVDEKISEKVKEIVETELLYDSIKEEDTASDIKLVLTKSGDRTIVEASILTTGKGTNYRKWVPEKPVLSTKSMTLTPISASNFYATKESFARQGASLALAAIGTQHEQNSYRAIQPKAAACPTTSAGVEKVERGAVARGIDRAGMAAGLGLLGSQAGGKIKGVKATFDVTGHEEELKDAEFKAAVTNSDEHRTLYVTVPARFGSE